MTIRGRHWFSADSEVLERVVRTVRIKALAPALLILGLSLNVQVSLAQVEAEAQASESQAGQAPLKKTDAVAEKQSQNAAAKFDATPGPVKDLSYGDVLFHFYSGDYFSSATRVLVAQEQDRLAHHADDAQLLLGGLYLSYGQQDAAAEIFSNLLATTKPSVRDRAWLYLAEIAWQRGQNDRAASALESMGNDLDDEFIARRQLLQARLAIDEQQFERAVAVLSDWQGGEELAAYAQFNLGVALIRHGKVEQGSEFLQQVGDGKIRAPGASRWQWPERLKLFSSSKKKSKQGRLTAKDESQAIRDKANLALGFAHLQKDQAGAALEYLTQIKKNSALYSKATLGSGWAASELGDYRGALKYWQTLEGGDRLDSAVQEALLAVPYAKRYLGEDVDAIAQYQQAIEQFEVEIDSLNSFKDKIDHGAFLQALLEQESTDSVGWFWQLKAVPNSPESRYLYHLVADHAFQEGLKNYRDLLFLENNLVNWKSRLGVYRNMLTAQETRFSEKLSTQAEEGVVTQLKSLQQRVQTARISLESVEQERDAVALATATEKESWDRLVSMEQKLQRHSSSRATVAKEKQRLLKGIMLWDLEQAYPARVWQAKKNVKELESQLTKAITLNLALANAKTSTPLRFAGFDGRIDALVPRIDTMLQGVQGQLNAHQGYLADLASQQFDSHKERLTAYLAEAQFALASAYDQAAVRQGDE